MLDARPSPEDARDALRRADRADEREAVDRLRGLAALDGAARARIHAEATRLVEAVRADADPGLMETFLAEYGLTTQEGVALMCLAEALLRTPDAETVDALIEDKIGPADWSGHRGRSASPLVNASTWALLITGKVLRDEPPGLAGALRGAVKRLGEPVIRASVGRAMKMLGRQFVLGETIESAMERAAAMERRGWLYSYDMLGEAARTEADARRYMQAYERAIDAIAPAARSDDMALNPGISIKLSALHPRYERAQAERVMAELAPRAAALARRAKAAGMGLNVDAEEADRLDLSLDVIEAALSDPELSGWDGFGVVVQAYSPRAPHVLDWLHALAERLDRRIMVRLVKGAYWDAEIKRAQTLGLEHFPVFTRKEATDLCWIACARKLLGMTDRLYPQFATHNAHSMAAVLEMAAQGGVGLSAFEFQRLHGMGEAMHRAVKAQAGARHRIYAPVGAHEDLLAYLVRRLLENGANSSFVNRIVDARVPAAEVARDPLERLEAPDALPNPAVRRPAELFPNRRNARGWDLTDPLDLAEIEAARAPWAAHRWRAGPMLAEPGASRRAAERRNPARPGDVVGEVADAAAEDAAPALAAARAAQPGWEGLGAPARADILRRAADLYEANWGELFALIAREAGKTLPDCVAELREAVDFLRFYAAEAERLARERPRLAPRGVFVCVSPWNFPLAIFTGQVSAALAAGCAVVAKPAEQTPLIAARAAELLREAGAPPGALQLLPGDGPGVGAALAGAAAIDGLCFTGSTATAQAINRAMARAAPPDAPLIAETGGLNAMIVDSTALPEQAVRDILASAFQSAGQRCSALRMLYLQEETAERTLRMLAGAMETLRVGDPWALSTDLGPLIDAEARGEVEAHVAAAEAEGRLLKRVAAPEAGFFAGPALIRVDGVAELGEEVFGPALQVATYPAEALDRVMDDVNAAGYGLTFGLHTRIDARVQRALDRVRAGNLYVNRNQIGAVVGSQPFGGEALSGTGPKAGGPAYLPRFMREAAPAAEAGASSGGVPGAPAPVESAALQALIDRTPRPDLRPREAVELPGPSGEVNRLHWAPRGLALCLGATLEAAGRQAEAARASGCAALVVAPGATGPQALDGRLAPEALIRLRGIDAVALEADAETLRAARRALAAREGPLVPLIAAPDPERFRVERHLCVDATASGGDAALLAAAA